jgi:hypothetical protein
MLRRQSKCQKRPTKGAKEAYFMRTFESLPGCWCREHQYPPSQKRPTKGAKEAYYVRTFESLPDFWCREHQLRVKRDLLKGQKRSTICGLLRACLAVGVESPNALRVHYQILDRLPILARTRHHLMRENTLVREHILIRVHYQKLDRLPIFARTRHHLIPGNCENSVPYLKFKFLFG